MTIAQTTPNIKLFLTVFNVYLINQTTNNKVYK